MKTYNKNKKAYNIIVFEGMAFLILMLFVFCYVKAEEQSISSISNGESTLSEEDQEKLEDLKKKAEIYRQIIEIKQKQGESLGNQISVMDSNIQELQTKIDLSSRQIDEYNSQILRIEAQIKEKNDLIESRKKLLSNIMQSYYEINQAGLITAYLSDRNIASFMLTKDRMSQTGDKIRDLVNSITEIKNELMAQSVELDEKKGKIVEEKQKLSDQNSNLSSIKAEKTSLLSQTQGEEERYRKLLEKVEEQKQELLDIDQFFAASGLSSDSYPKPDSKYFASTDWYFAQWDKRWGDKTIGNTKTLMKSYGCAITSVAMVANFYGNDITPGELAKKPIYYYDLISWQMNSWSGAEITLNMKYGYSHGNISWKVIDSEIGKNHPVIVYIKKSNGGGGHYVVVHHKDSNGKYVVHDPYFGANIFLDTSRALVGAMGKSSSTVVDQMIIYND